MEDVEWLAERFREHGPRLRAVAYRMLGSLAEVDDALQDAWLRASKADTQAAEIETPAAWLTTLVARVCLNALRTRKARAEEFFDGHLPDPILGADDASSPEDAALQEESLGLALQIVLDALSPDERVAFVLHDMFDVPFDDIAAVLERSPAAARQSASRARRRVAQERIHKPQPDLARQRVVVEAFFAAARNGDLQALIAVLHPDVVARADYGAHRLTPALQTTLHGAAQVAANARIGYVPDAEHRPVVVNGDPGVLISRRGRAMNLLVFGVADGRIVSLHVYADRERVVELARLLPAEDES